MIPCCKRLADAGLSQEGAGLRTNRRRCGIHRAIGTTWHDHPDAGAAMTSRHRAQHVELRRDTHAVGDRRRIHEEGRRFRPFADGQPGYVHDDVSLHMADPENVGKTLRCNAVNKGRGRIKIRDATVCLDAPRCSGPASPAGPACNRKGQSDSGDQKGRGAKSRAASFSAKGLVRSGASRC